MGDWSVDNAGQRKVTEACAKQDLQRDGRTIPPKRASITRTRPLSPDANSVVYTSQYDANLTPRQEAKRRHHVSPSLSRTDTVGDGGRDGATQAPRNGATKNCLNVLINPKHKSSKSWRNGMPPITQGDRGDEPNRQAADQPKGIEATSLIGKPPITQGDRGGKPTTKCNDERRGEKSNGYFSTGVRGERVRTGVHRCNFDAPQ
jgi:hypothetical protein